MNEKICRLCLQTIINNNCQSIGESLLKTLKLKPNISKETMMCVDCANCLQVFSKFTPRLVHKEGRSVPLYELEGGIGLDPVRIEGTSNLESLMKTEIMCSFCTEAYGREDVVSLNDSNENKFMVNMLEQYISKMNLNNTEQLLTCGACLEKLEGVSGVILKCLEVEKKISEYIELKGTDDKSQIELKELQLFMSRPEIKLEIDSASMDNLEGSCAQIKEEYTVMAKLEIKCETDISHPELIIKTDDDIKSEHSDCDITDTKSEMRDCDRLQEPFVANIPTWEPEMFKCELCPYKAKRRNHLEAHLLTHKSPLEPKKFKCELCPYKTKHKSHLNTHVLIHKSPSELKMFKCDLCSYEAKQNSHLARHLLTHKSPSELKMFKCELCPHETKFKADLKQHLLTHKCRSELKMFKCELCPLKTKYKGALKQHLLIHKSPSELKMFKCTLCSYETKYKRHLERHLLTHRSLQS